MVTYIVNDFYQNSGSPFSPRYRCNMWCYVADRKRTNQYTEENLKYNKIKRTLLDRSDVVVYGLWIVAGLKPVREVAICVLHIPLVCEVGTPRRR